jgi:hypothetical protein
MNDSERDQLLIRVDTNVARLMTDSTDHDTRLRSLEATKNSQKGAITIATAIVSGLWAGVLALVGIFWSK